MSVQASVEPIAADLKRVGNKIDEQNEFIYLYINLMFFALMIYGNYLYYAIDMPKREFCKRTSGYFQ